MLEVNGAAGGQILRTALGLSAITLEPVKIYNIRRFRPKPGLKAQHLTALNLVSSITEAKVKGNKKHSQVVSFTPKKITGGNYSVNIGTAGSVTLLLQAVLLPALFAEKPLSLRVNGGTNVSWSPPVEFLQEVFFPVLRKMGARFELKVIQRGYFPKGNGLIIFSSLKSSLPLKPLNLIKRGKLELIKVISHCKNLPKEVALNQASAAKKILSSKFSTEIETVIDYSSIGEGEGSGITIIAFFSNGLRIAGSALGEKSLPAIKVGKSAAKNFLEEFNSSAAVDSYLADQLIPFLALAHGTSRISVSRISEHTKNNIKTVEKFLNTKITVLKEKTPPEIIVQGIGLKK
jgi:RNA 3'-phosphate cyclase